MENMIVTDPNVLGGKPVIRGTRISVGFVLKLVSSGLSMEKILENYPHLTREGINAAIEYASNVMEGERVFPVVEQADRESSG